MNAKNEPVMVIAIVQAALAVAAAFGLKLSAEQIGAVSALAALVLGLLARQFVMPAHVAQAAIQDAAFRD